MRNKRGQAAMEFLMTYGWAILAAIIAIGVLAYFGVFSPGQYVGSSAVVTAPWYANAWNIDTTNVNLELQNNGGETLTIHDVSVDPSDGATGCTNTGLVGAVNSSGSQIVNVACAGMTSGSTFRGDITITYSRPSSGLNLTSTGSITDTVR
ncbi:hypothetical protein CO038_01035 [Candidatus Pacearchaeota archaeon CG_4_9_14_0_2_um_filter_39_13]|nr:hypothetical protein [Candidatus Pacearchaeota archaeon]OIO43112.1 MAG: hypothetical protein AUJ64_02930 [Candidatus Pacearchaeota archaeon CG1_02_39_14]PJC44960.1 MAG: hypothetical protein CO038_01035 [Candidatus Pacearchaeota archaeon CG_4_9_14_0_2_um_filter_39_13]